MNTITFEGEANWSPPWFSSGWRKSQPLIWSGSYLEMRNALSSPSLHNLISSTPNNTKPLRISTWSQGLNMLRIIYEPTATTIAYGLDKKGGCWEECVDCRSWWWWWYLLCVVPSDHRGGRHLHLRSEGLYCWWPSLGRRGCRQSPRGPSLLLQEFERNSSSRTYSFVQRRAAKLSIYLTYSSDEVGMMRNDLTCSSTAYSSTVHSQIWKVLKQ